METRTAVDRKAAEPLSIESITGRPEGRRGHGGNLGDRGLLWVLRSHQPRKFESLFRLVFLEMYE